MDRSQILRPDLHRPSGNMRRLSRSSHTLRDMTVRSVRHPGWYRLTRGQFRSMYTMEQGMMLSVNQHVSD